MNLGFVDRSTVLHEFGHSLGLIHEHQSPFKGGFEWNRDEVGMKEARKSIVMTNQVKHSSFDVLGLNGAIETLYQDTKPLVLEIARQCHLYVVSQLCGTSMAVYVYKDVPTPLP